MAVWAAIRPKSSGVTSRVCDLVLVTARCISGSSSGSSGSRISPVSGSTVALGSLAAASACLGEQLLLEPGRQDQLEDAEVRGVVVEVDLAYLAAPGVFL